MGLFLGVARGSVEPPRLLVLKYAPAGAPADKTLGLIGKGITFDTGGISIKPSDGMERMKDDMAGGASVVAALRAIALQKLPVRTVVVVPMTENMPSGTATKPGDIHKGASGLTVEINNTDAEGRLILGDALWYARKLGATHLVDVATLTGAVVVALGKITTGLYGTPQPWVDHAARRGRSRRRKGVAAAVVRRVPRTAEERDCGPVEQPGPARRLDHRRDVPEGICRRRRVGAPGYCRHRVGGRGEVVAAQGRHRRDDPDADRGGARRPELGASGIIKAVQHRRHNRHDRSDFARRSRPSS